ncbi:aldo/keto reductase [Kitasatospora griseola]|uniref:aldo/keto reductase n=1 Tax=Kitasatospora griseola TaxID=2064 RepID=UPI003820F981
MEELLDEGRVRAIGVSDLYSDRYLDLITHHRVVPAVNQREVHPFHQQDEAKAVQDRHGTVLQAWGPLAQGNPDLYFHPVLQHIAATHGRSIPQIVLHSAPARHPPGRQEHRPRPAAPEPRRLRLPTHRRRDDHHRPTRPRPARPGLHPPGPADARTTPSSPAGSWPSPSR